MRTDRRMDRQQETDSRFLQFCERAQKVKILLYPLFPDFRNIISILSVPNLRPFVLLVRATCRKGSEEQKWNYINRRTTKYSERNLPPVTSSTTNLNRLYWNRNEVCNQTHT